LVLYSRRKIMPTTEFEQDCADDRIHDEFMRLI
jgi:hypothetical protein